MDNENQIPKTAPQTRQDPNVGLTAQEAQRRLDTGWGNAVAGKYTRTVCQILAGNLLTFFNLVFTINIIM